MNTSAQPTASLSATQAQLAQRTGAASGPMAASATSRWDSAGGAASLLCAFHCLLAPFLPAIISSAGVLALSERSEWLFAITACVCAVFAAVTGLRRHGVAWVLLPFGLGLVCLLAGRGIESVSTETLAHILPSGVSLPSGRFMSISGGLFLVIGHLLNRKKCTQAGCKDEACSNG